MISWAWIHNITVCVCVRVCMWYQGPLRASSRMSHRTLLSLVKQVFNKIYYNVINFTRIQFEMCVCDGVCSQARASTCDVTFWLPIPKPLPLLQLQNFTTAGTWKRQCKGPGSLITDWNANASWTLACRDYEMEKTENAVTVVGL